MSLQLHGDNQITMDVEQFHEIVYQAVGAGTAPLMQDHPDYVFPSERVTEGVDRVLTEFGIPAAQGYQRTVQERRMSFTEPDAEGAGSVKARIDQILEEQDQARATRQGETTTQEDN